MKASESDPTSSHSKERTMRPPSCLADLPIPTPPPMANLFVTSRFDYTSRGTYSFRRLLNSTGELGRLPNITTRTDSFELPYVYDYNTRESYKCIPRRTEYSEQSRSCGSTPILNRKSTNIQDYCSNQEDNLDCKSQKPEKYLSTVSDLNREFNEVQELRQSFCDYQDMEDIISGLPQGAQKNQYYNDHYISDIDENEEVKQFCYKYEAPEPNLLGVSDTSGYSSRTLPIKCSKNIPVPSRNNKRKSDGCYGSFSSLKSSDFAISPIFGRETDVSYSQKIVRTPMRPVVKIAKIR